MIDPGVKARVDRAIQLIGSEDEGDNRELGFLVFELSQIVQRDPATKIESTAVRYKIERMLSGQKHG